VEWISFPRAQIDAALGLFQRQRERFRADAARIQEEIEAYGRESGAQGSG
jgi:hypothetical protein